MTAQDKLHTAGCIQGGQPPCTCGCPLNFDIKKFITKIRAGNLQTSYRDLANRTVFPGIVCHICDQRCMQACPANLSMQALEQACVTHVRNRDAQTWALPKKKQRVAILGAGIAGMACAQKLATKKYEVTVYDRADQTGGNLRQILDESIIQAEFSHQFHNLDYTLLLNHEVRTTDHLDQDAIFIATGSGGMDFGLRAGWNGQSMATKKAGVFLGGMLMRENRMDALADGIIAAISIERYLLVASMSGQQESFYSHECTLPPANGREIATPVKATGDGYTKEEAAEEAARCLLCDCTESDRGGGDECPGYGAKPRGPGRHQTDRLLRPLRTLYRCVRRRREPGAADAGKQAASL